MKKKLIILSKIFTISSNRQIKKGLIFGCTRLSIASPIFVNINTDTINKAIASPGERKGISLFIALIFRTVPKMPARINETR